jgi:hypothetical protein
MNSLNSPKSPRSPHLVSRLQPAIVNFFGSPPAAAASSVPALLPGSPAASAMGAGGDAAKKRKVHEPAPQLEPAPDAPAPPSQLQVGHDQMDIEVDIDDAAILARALTLIPPDSSRDDVDTMRAYCDTTLNLLSGHYRSHSTQLKRLVSEYLKAQDAVAKLDTALKANTPPKSLLSHVKLSLSAEFAANEAEFTKLQKERALEDTFRLKGIRDTAVQLANDAVQKHVLDFADLVVKLRPSRGLLTAHAQQRVLATIIHHFRTLDRSTIASLTRAAKLKREAQLAAQAKRSQAKADVVADPEASVKAYIDYRLQASERRGRPRQQQPKNERRRPPTPAKGLQPQRRNRAGTSNKPQPQPAGSRSSSRQPRNPPRRGRRPPQPLPRSGAASASSKRRPQTSSRKPQQQQRRPSAGIAAAAASPAAARAPRGQSQNSRGRRPAAQRGRPGRDSRRSTG